MNIAPEVLIWGTGAPRREFLHADDMAAASISVMGLEKALYDQHTDPMISHINVGSGSDIPIADLAAVIAKATDYHGKISFDISKPDGPLRKWIDSSRLNQLGWTAKIQLEAGLKSTYEDIKSHLSV